MGDLPPRVILQSVASGRLGPAAYQGGMPVAALGALRHYGLALIAAGAFVAGLRMKPTALTRPLLWGMLAGVVMYAVMRFAVVPLSNAAVGESTPVRHLIGLTIHITLFGLPLSYTVFWVLRRQPV